ncbi:hypothetical protein [Thiomicrorhabdus sp.]|uniref:hypothetical protein n=1 Tax=Thiomicrorhabdus sp. TaxID=2039724 RepID=UPI0029C763C2|nr:hypothetical protein [Thiomicrorhabdus sp.]
MLFWLLKAVGKPIERLGEWSKNLSVDTVGEPIPDFRYKELNDLAGLIRHGLVASHRSLEREQRFLQYASHELRTPIAVIR